MRTRTRHIALCLPGVIFLAGCTTMYKDGSDTLALKVVPSQTVRHGAERAEAQYVLGRYYRGQLRHELAIKAFRAALQANPDHAEARNALGVTLASQGRQEQAIAELEKAVESAPRSASIRNNLGYAYLLHGRVAEAVTTLEMASALDPASPRARDNLQMARESAAVAEKMAQVQAAAPAAGMAPAAPMLPVPEASSPPHATQATPGIGARARLEISNGNGVGGMARSTSRQLQSEGYARPRLTNAPNFRLRTTEIQYRPGFEPQARALQGLLRQGVPIAESSRLRHDVQVRLTLGKDATSTAALVAQGGSPMRVADAR